MRDILQYLQIAPQGGPAGKHDQETHLTVPAVINLPVADAVRELKAAGLAARVEEEGERVADQVPKPLSRVPTGASVLLYTQTPRYGGGEITIPDLAGLTSREATALLAELGLLIGPEGGGGPADRQDPAPGDKVPAGSKVKVHFGEEPANIGNSGNTNIKPPGP
jgi:stage V sporulation protein D (sporulation-specific penicillin-binding protein)